jgi:hypothetical protein
MAENENMLQVAELTPEQLEARIRKWTRVFKTGTGDPEVRTKLKALLLEKEKRHVVAFTDEQLAATIAQYREKVRAGGRGADEILERLIQEDTRRKAPSASVPALAKVKRATEPAAVSSYGWTPAQNVAFVVFMLFGLPLLRTVCHSPNKPSRLSANTFGSSWQKSNASPSDRPHNSTKAAESSSRRLSPLTAESAIALLPQDGIYSQTAGTGGNYRDPMNRYFEVQPPAGWQIVEKRDKGTFTFGPDSTQPGRVVPRSWIIFRKDGAEVGVIARESFSSIEQDFDLVVKGFREGAGAMVERSRFVTIDGAKGGELVSSVKGVRLLAVKYKKNGLDHAITMTCPASDVPKVFPVFDQFLRSYRSLEIAKPRTRP